MTLRQLTKRVDFWLKRLLPLGLCHWTVHVSIVNEVDSPFAVLANASCSCSTHYDTMWLEFRRDFLDETDLETLDGVIVHELLHATMRDLDHTVEGVGQYLGEPHKSAYQEELLHAREGFVEKMARAIQYSAMQDVVRYTT